MVPRDWEAARSPTLWFAERVSTLQSEPLQHDATRVTTAGVPAIWHSIVRVTIVESSNVIGSSSDTTHLQSTSGTLKARVPGPSTSGAREVAGFPPGMNWTV